jgi:hypothetical protein
MKLLPAPDRLLAPDEIPYPLKKLRVSSRPELKTVAPLPNPIVEPLISKTTPDSTVTVTLLLLVLVED